MPVMPNGLFGLSEDPFVEGHDARFVYPSRAHREVVTRLRRGIENREPFMLVTGLPGVGKTIAVQAALAEAEPPTLVLIAASPSLSHAKFRERILSGFAPDASEPATPARPAAGIEARLRAVRARGRSALLVVDEAQNLGVPLFEELRVLSNLEADGRNLLQIILAGQPRLEEDLSRPGCDALRQRIAVRCRLGALSAEETESYIRHRLAVAGGDSQSLFTRESCQAVHRLAHGIPREINLVAGEAIMLAHAAGESAIAAGHIAGAAVLLGFRSVVDDSRSTGDAVKPVAAATVELLPPADSDSSLDEREGTETRHPVLPGVSLPASCEVPPAGRGEDSTILDVETSAPGPLEVALASRPKKALVEIETFVPAPGEAPLAGRAQESPFVKADLSVPAPSGNPPPASTRPVGPAAKATPASLENPEVEAWLARFRDPNGPPKIGSRLAVVTMVSEVIKPRTSDAADEQPAVPALLHQPGGRRSTLRRRRSSWGDRMWRSATWTAGALLLLVAGGLVLATWGRSLLRARPVTRAAIETTVGEVDHTRTLSAAVARPSLVPVPPTAAPRRSPARAASASSRASAPTPRAPAPPARCYGVEVANFIVESRAVEERDRLVARISLPCGIATSREDGAEIYSILVGPVASRQEAVRLSEDLSERILVGQARVVRWASSDSTRR
jgi:type II secretory pathway predicted ATPase ExeA